ncbi:VOC family protein [Pseudonocardia endophytica]|uniref:Glyoxalase-like domain-containing protein n=1 Tax=Pseudonocardia endophytica TaxID=401976 RepID=A0A4R1HW79_PSEEN|nr:VOC family protein [Pseudonocardia endophytica]TCK27004.1 hypothetical protein EV378_2854 [Pseudonocardia endophytica]
MPIAKLSLTALDCPDTLALALFYSRITGWPVADDSHPGWAELESGGAGATLAFQLVEDGEFRPPEWPGQEHPQRMHVDFDVPDLDEGERAVLEIGARKHDVQPKPDSFRVFLDPIGHPFCLVKA